MRARLVMVDEELMAFASAPLTASAAGRAQGGMDETVALPPADNLRLAFEDADLVAQHQQLGLISGAVAKRCQGDVDEEPEAGLKDEEEHGRRLLVAAPRGSPLSSDGLLAPHTSCRTSSPSPAARRGASVVRRCWQGGAGRLRRSEGCRRRGGRPRERDAPLGRSRGMPRPRRGRGDARG